MTTLIALLAAGLLTWLLRAWFLVAGERPLAPAVVRFVVPARVAVLGALVAAGTASMLWASATPGEGLVLVAALFAGGIVAFRRGNLAATMGAGMVTAWTATLLLPL